MRAVAVILGLHLFTFFIAPFLWCTVGAIGDPWTYWELDVTQDLMWLCGLSYFFPLVFRK